MLLVVMFFCCVKCLNNLDFVNTWMSYIYTHTHTNCLSMCAGKTTEHEVRSGNHATPAASTGFFKNFSFAFICWTVFYFV